MVIIVALVAGFLSAFSPCFAPMIPIYALRGIQPWRLGLTVAIGTFLTMIASVWLLDTAGSVGEIIGIVGLIICGLLLLFDRADRFLSSWAGLGVGLAWAPCLGPIAGGIIALGGATGTLLVVVYCAGLFTGILAVSQATKRFRQRLAHTLVQQAMGVFMLLMAIGLIVFSGWSSSVASNLPLWGSITAGIEQPLAGQIIRSTQHAQPLQGHWLTKPASVKGKRTLVVFWSYNCAACVESMPAINQLRHQYHMQVILVHSPQYRWVNDRAFIQSQAAHYGMGDLPLLDDNRLQTWRAWGGSAWPWHVLVDESGRVIASHSGSSLTDIKQALQTGTGTVEQTFTQGRGTAWNTTGSWKQQGGILTAGNNASIRMTRPSFIQIRTAHPIGIRTPGGVITLRGTSWYSPAGTTRLPPRTQLLTWRANKPL